jgi:hypothetical protein
VALSNTNESGGDSYIKKLYSTITDLIAEETK